MEIKKMQMDDWEWDVERKRKVSGKWLSAVQIWDITVAIENRSYFAVAVGEKEDALMFRGTESQCQDFIDEQTA